MRWSVLGTDLTRELFNEPVVFETRIVGGRRISENPDW